MTKEDEASVSPGKRSSGRAKKVDYAALQEIKIEEVDIESDDSEPKPVEVVVQPQKKRKREDISDASELVTEGKCGQCTGCLGSACFECSFCKNGDTSQCIDLYCINDKEGRSQRQAAREAYLLSMGKARLQKIQPSESGDCCHDDDHDVVPAEAVDFTPKQNLSVQEQIDMIMEQIGAAQKNRQKSAISTNDVQPEKPKAQASKPRKPKQNNPTNKAPRHHSGIYGGSSKAAKSRRCGECEGCMRDDCGQCPACADKPRFGGRGTKKKACVMRYCRTRKLEEDHAAANFPLNSPDALKKRPTPKLGVTNSVGKVDDEEVEVEDAILQD